MFDSFKLGAESVEEIKTQEDQEMTISPSKDYSSILNEESKVFESLILYMIDLLAERSQGSADFSDIEMSVHSPNRKGSSRNSLAAPKEHSYFTGEHMSLKKNFGDGTVNTKVSEPSKARALQDLNLLNCADSNGDGLVALCENGQVCLVAGS
jgi:hypothetical protein